MTHLLEKYNVEIALFEIHEKWLRTKARDVSSNDPILDLNLLMQHFREEHEWLAVSSNNIYWDGTETPIRMIQVPDPNNDYITIINPKITYRKGSITSYEGCAAFPEKKFTAVRPSAFKLSGLNLYLNPIQFKYTPNKSETEYFPKTALVQHEVDHLEGRLLIDHGKEF